MSIPYESRREVYLHAIDHYGVEWQIWKAVEEMAELMKELSDQHTRDRTIIEKTVDEIADVTIMMEQLRLIFHVNQDVQDRIDFKVRRLAQRTGYGGEICGGDTL